MRIIFAALLIAGANYAFAQEEVSKASPAPPSGAIVKPTSEQLKTLPTEIPNKKVETTTEVTEMKTNLNPHLFGFHADFNVPHLMNYGLDYWHSSRWFSLSANMGGGSVPSSTLKSYISDVDEPSLKISNVEAVARYHIFAGSFYLGLGYGNHTIDAAGNKTVTITSPVPGSATVRLTDRIKSNYLTPHVGWLWKLDVGLTFGFDIGYMAPSGASVELKEEALTALPGGASLADFQSTAEYQKARKDVIDASEQIGKKGLPYLALFRIGYMF